MIEKIVFLLMVWIPAVAYDKSALKKESGAGKAAYGLLIIAAVYFSIDYVLVSPLPNLDDAVRFFLQQHAERILAAFKANLS